MWFITRPPESRTRIFSIAKPALKTRPCFYLFLNFFLWPGSQAVATRQDYSYAVKPGTFAGATTVAAKSGEIIILWATGFGPTTPSAPSGVSVPGNGSYPTATSPTVTIGNTAAIVYDSALAPGSAGLYQIAIQVPNTLADGERPIQAGIGGALSPTGVVLSVAD